jgi:3-deoxy-D-arabino-heptulosonate 7-phosphate (DAHP) synthase class II
LQLPEYADAGQRALFRFDATVQPYFLTDLAASIASRLKCLPPLVSANEVSQLSSLLQSLAHSRHGFILQGGDCAEMFDDCKPATIDAKIRLLHDVADVLLPAAGVVVKIGRIAGQYAKPRSSITEAAADGSVTLSYRFCFAFDVVYFGCFLILLFRGDAINCFDMEHRAADPSRMMLAYWHAAATLNYMRLQGYIRSDCNSVFTSHECLLLPMEEAVTDASTRLNQVNCSCVICQLQFVRLKSFRAPTCCGLECERETSTVLIASS